jgi:hypothetical protein
MLQAQKCPEQRLKPTHLTKCCAALHVSDNAAHSSSSHLLLDAYGLRY